MTDPTIPVTEDELHAYVDNELPAERRGDGAVNPLARRPHQPLDLQPLRHRLVGHLIVPGMQRFRHRAP